MDTQKKKKNTRDTADLPGKRLARPVMGNLQWRKDGKNSRRKNVGRGET